jgi:hypothetical protein
VNVLLWHLHGSWTTAFVQGHHRYIVPVLPGRGPYGWGRAATWQWPGSVVEMAPNEVAAEDVDVVILQRPEELGGLAEGWLGGRRPGIDVPAVYVEHNCPQGRIAEMRHPVADRADIPVVHVTHFNALFWDTGKAPTRVIEHGIVDPGYQYSGALERVVAVVNEPGRRGRVTGTDILERVGRSVPIDLFGMQTESFGGRAVPQHELHEEMARRRVYLHPVRWTSLGLSLVEAMQLGMPIVSVATTEVCEAVSDRAGIVTNRADVLMSALRRLLNEPEEAIAMGKAARQEALSRFGLDRFLGDWDLCLGEVGG